MGLPAEPISSSKSRNSVGPMMLCPFCAEEIRDEAIFCRHCRHDLTIPKPLMEQAKALQQRIGELEAELAGLRAAAARQPVDRSPPELTGEAHGSLEHAKCVLIYTLVPTALIVLAHYLMLYRLGFPRIFIQLVCIGITLPFGYDMWCRMRWGPAAAVVIATVVAVLAFVGTSIVVWMVDGVAIMPANPAEWRLTIELAIGLALATVTGNLFASVLETRHAGEPAGIAGLGARVLTAVVGPPREGQTMVDRLNTVEKTIKSVMATAAAIGALYTGIKSGMP